MKITELISVFERLLPIYEKAYKEKWYRKQLVSNHLTIGLCNFELNTFDTGSLYRVVPRYYKNILDEDGYLFPYPDTYKDLKPRIDFMKSEIKDLKRLIKKGYTHV